MGPSTMSVRCFGTAHCVLCCGPICLLALNEVGGNTITDVIYMIGMHAMLRSYNCGV